VKINAQRSVYGLAINSTPCKIKVMSEEHHISGFKVLVNSIEGIVFVTTDTGSSPLVTWERNNPRCVEWGVFVNEVRKALGIDLGFLSP